MASMSKGCEHRGAGSAAVDTCHQPNRNEAPESESDQFGNRTVGGAGQFEICSLARHHASKFEAGEHPLR
jgi:hypothetical protein